MKAILRNTKLTVIGLTCAFGCAGGVDDVAPEGGFGFESTATGTSKLESARRGHDSKDSAIGNIRRLHPKCKLKAKGKLKVEPLCPTTYCCETRELVGGQKDCFAAPEDPATLVDNTANPIETYLTSNGIPASKRAQFDSTQVDRFFVHTITFGYSASTINASCKFGLNVRVRAPGSSVPQNDNLTILVFDVATQAWQTPYSQYIGWTGASAPTTKYIDLKPLANQVGGKAYINVLIQDDTFVDYIELVRGQSSPVACPPDPPPPTFTASTSWHVAIEQNAMLTSCGTQTNIAVGAATNCPDAITAAEALFNPAISDCLKPNCKAWLESANPGLVVSSPANVSIVEGAPSCWADPYTVNGNPRTRYQVTIPLQCVYTAPAVPACVD